MSNLRNIYTTSYNILQMKIIKLNAINSTNSFLKEMMCNSKVDDFTVVVTKKQVTGRGQMQTKWISEPGKNLTFSVFCSFKALGVSNKKYLNYAVSVSVFEVVNRLKVPKLAIKWPNDILSDKAKICGILIENTLKGSFIGSSIIGVGLNVNQVTFPDNLPNATSIKNKIDKDVNLDNLLNDILIALKINIALLKTKNYQELENKYLDNLYRKNIPSMFKTASDELFMGKIVGVSKTGLLQIELENEMIKEFGLKEVSFV